MAHPARKLTIANYLAWENDQPERHEFYGGEVISRQDARRVHGWVVGNLSAELKDAPGA